MKNFLLTALLGATLSATEESPWIDTVLQPVACVSFNYQYFNQIISGSQACCYPGRDFFMDSGLFFALSTDVSFEVETRFTKSHAHGFALDQVKESCRYIVLDDARGDLFAFSLGLELVEPISFGLKDLSFIHHALFELEFHASFGKEWSYEAERIARIYSTGAIGCGIEGSPWTRGELLAEYELNQCHLFQGRLSAEMGFGGKRLHENHFHGYGKIAYRIIDASFEYFYLSETCEISLKYLHSLYRRNCPYDVQMASINISYPFTL